MSLGMTLLRSADVKNIYPESGWEITEVCLGYREPFPVVRNRDFSLLVEKQKLGGKKKKLPILLLRAGKQMMPEKGLV